MEAGRIRVIFRSQVKRFDDGVAALEVEGAGVSPVKFHHAFVLIGADPPAEFLRSLGLRLEGAWTGSPLLASALVRVTFLGIWLPGGQRPVAGRNRAQAA